MDDKVYDLLTKMYSDFSGKFDNVEKRLVKIETVLENDIKGDIKALFDGYKQTYEEVKEVKDAVADLSSKLEKQEVEIKVIKGGK